MMTTDYDNTDDVSIAIVVVAVVVIAAGTAAAAVAAADDDNDDCDNDDPRIYGSIKQDYYSSSSLYVIVRK